MLEIIKAIIYGIVEGITEWLPISSTGRCSHSAGSYFSGGCIVLEQDLALLPEEK